MASYFVQVDRVAILTAMSGGTAYSRTSPLKAALCSTTGSTTSAGTEDTGGSYARQNMGPGTPSAAAPSVMSNTASVNYTGMPALTSNGTDIYDSNATPIRCCGGDLTTPKTTASGDSLSFAIGSLAINL